MTPCDFSWWQHTGGGGGLWKFLYVDVPTQGANLTFKFCFTCYIHVGLPIYFCPNFCTVPKNFDQMGAFYGINLLKIHPLCALHLRLWLPSSWRLFEKLWKVCAAQILKSIYQDLRNWFLGLKLGSQGTIFCKICVSADTWSISVKIGLDNAFFPQK